VSGEELHEIGRDGTIRAKRWLEATTRVDASWINPGAAQKLTFHWADGKSSFSFDLGGTMRGGEWHGEEFFAEVKKYSSAGDQGAHYTSYLAKCYRAFTVMPARCDHFMWVTWHPFKVGKWADLCSPDEVSESVITHRAAALGVVDLEDARQSIDDATCAAVAERLWLLVLSEKQERKLVIEQVDLDSVWAAQRRRTA
jgi:hypothetical protein